MATKTAKKVTPCRVKGCTKAAKNRGLCASHHQSAYIKVKAGSTTWDELEKLGIAAPKKVQSNGFGEFLAAKRASAKQGAKNAKNKAAIKKNKPKAKPAAPVIPGLAVPEKSSPES